MFASFLFWLFGAVGAVGMEFNIAVVSCLQPCYNFHCCWLSVRRPMQLPQGTEALHADFGT